MYIKVASDIPSLYEAPVDLYGITYGSRIVTTPPWEVDWSKELEVGFHTLSNHCKQIPAHPIPEGYDHDPYWMVSFAHWWSIEHQGYLGVVSTDPIFLLNDNGKTIDRVR